MGGELPLFYDVIGSFRLERSAVRPQISPKASGDMITYSQRVWHGQRVREGAPIHEQNDACQLLSYRTTPTSATLCRSNDAQFHYHQQGKAHLLGHGRISYMCPSPAKGSFSPSARDHGSALIQYWTALLSRLVLCHIVTAVI